jgi:hypothetical protein
MKIAVLGWGSLVWKPEPMKLKDRWHFDGPMLPIELARISRSSATNLERMTFVPYHGSKLIPVLWATAAQDDLDAAIRNLAGREGCDHENIGFVSVHEREFHSTTIPEMHEDISWWAAKKNIDAAIWTDLPSNFFEKTKGVLTEYNVLEYLKKQNKRGNDEPKEYIQKAPKQIKTRLRDAVQRELGW